MRLTRGSFRELHWHTADEWAVMLNGNARVTVLNPDGTIFIDDVSKGDLWFFPAGYPHSIQGLGPGDGCQFLLVFDEGMFSEDNTFLISDWVAHTAPEILTKNSNLDRSAIAKLPTDELYIFPANLPGSLAQDKAAVGGKECRVYHPIHLQDGGDGSHKENIRRRSPHRRLPQFPGFEDHCRRIGHH
jgi:oxalate decarboxylase